MSAPRGGVLGVVDRVPLPWLPVRYRKAMRDYLEHGVLPEGVLLELLQGQAVRLYTVQDTAELHELAAVQAWIDAHLPAQCWGNRDQVQLWIVYLQRARGRALLASFDEGVCDEANAGAATRHE